MNENAPTLTSLRIIWGALLASQGVYLYMVVSRLVPHDGDPPAPVMVTALSIVAMSCAMASLIIPRWMQRAALSSPESGLRELVGQPPDVVLAKSIKLGAQGFILGLALAESVAVFGLMLGILGAPLLTIAPFFAAAAMLFLTRFPTEGRFRGPIDEALATQR